MLFIVLICDSMLSMVRIDKSFTAAHVLVATNFSLRAAKEWQGKPETAYYVGKLPNN